MPRSMVAFASIETSSRDDTSPTRPSNTASATAPAATRSANRPTLALPATTWAEPGATSVISRRVRARRNLRRPARAAGGWRRSCVMPAISTHETAWAGIATPPPSPAVTQRAPRTGTRYRAFMPNRGYPREPDDSEQPGRPPAYDWLYDESGPPRPPGRRSRHGRSAASQSPRDAEPPTQVVRQPQGGQRPRGYPPQHQAPGGRPPGGYPPGGYPPPDADPYQQDSYGSDPYRQEPYGQDPRGRDPYGQDPYGSDPYRQDPYGQDSGDYDRPPPGRSPLQQPGPPGGRGRPRLPRRRRRIRWLRILLFVLLAYLIVLIGVPVLAWGRVDKVPFAPSGARPEGSAGTNYLLVGSDSREGLTPEERVRLGTGNAGGRRTDTIMLLHVPKLGGPPTLVSIPRDSYVPIPGHDRNKINAAFAFGGPKLLTATVENVTGLRVDGYVEIGLGGFVGVVEGLGGIEMCLPKPAKDEKAHIDLPAGCQELDGPNSLGYVRARHLDATGDLGRVERQRKFLAAVMNETLSPPTLLNPIRYTRVGLAGGDALTVGDTTGIFDTARFALAMRSVSSKDGVTLTVPIENPGLSTPVGSAVKWDSDEALELFHALRDGKPIPPSLLPKEK